MVQHLQKLINLFYKNHPEKLTATSLPIDCISPITKLIIKPTKYITKRKQGQLANRVSKKAKKN